jgi:N-dimethylarginine dimethylaminohydrolase
MSIPYGAQSAVADLQHVLVHPPHDAFGDAFEDPAHGYLEPVDLALARKEHESFTRLLRDLGVKVHELASDSASPDIIYQYDPALVSDDGVILLRSGKPNRRGEEDHVADWFESAGIPLAGRIEAPGTVDGGDVFWLRHDLMCVGRTLRTNQAGIDQLQKIVSGRVEVFDMPYDAGEAECLHLMSVISPIDEDLVVVELERLPSGLYRLFEELGVEMVSIPQSEVASLACNVLTVRPRVVVMLEGNPVTQAALEARGVEVHTYAGSQICINGSGGPTCLTRPVRRA